MARSSSYEVESTSGSGTFIWRRGGEPLEPASGDPLEPPYLHFSHMEEAGEVKRTLKSHQEEPFE